MIINFFKVFFIEIILDILNINSFARYVELI